MDEAARDIASLLSFAKFIAISRPKVLTLAWDEYDSHVELWIFGYTFILYGIFVIMLRVSGKQCPSPIRGIKDPSVFHFVQIPYR
jgi:hypothetical protein